jgi:hypothetical protein
VDRLLLVRARTRWHPHCARHGRRGRERLGAHRVRPGGGEW